MYRAQDREEDGDYSGSMLTTTAWYSWPDLEPALLSAIAKRLNKQDQGSMRLVCRAWHTAVSDGIYDLAVVSLSSSVNVTSMCHQWNLDPMGGERQRKLTVASLIAWPLYTRYCGC